MSPDQFPNTLLFHSAPLPLRALVPSWFQFLLQPVRLSTLRFTVLLSVVCGLSSPAFAQTNVFPSTGNVGIGTTSPSANLEVTGTVKIQGVLVDPSLPPDNAIYFTPQTYFEAGTFPFSLLAGTAPVFALTGDPAVPFGKVALSAGLTEFASDFIPVQPGETLYGEIWAMRPSGSAGAPGLFYYGVARYDKDKRPIDGNLALHYFAANAVTVAQNGVWTKYSGTTSLPLSHTPYSSSDGGPVRYVRAYIIVNYNTGTIPTYWGGVVLRRTAPFRDAAPVVFKGNVGIGTTNPEGRLSIAAGASGIEAEALRFNRTEDGARYNSIYNLSDDSGNAAMSFRIHDGATATSQATVMTLKGNGNVGIGTTSPDGKLNINNAPNSWTANSWSKGLRLDGIHAIEFGGGASVKYGVGQSDNALYFFDTTAEDNSAPAAYRMVLRAGNVGIGTTNPTHKLAVNGTVRAKEVIVDTGWADYVFKKGYRLAPLTEVEAHIEREGHLPGIPSATEVAEHGVSMGEMQAKMMAKIEELTLHVIRQEKENSAQSARLAALETENDKLRRQLSKASLNQ